MHFDIMAKAKKRINYWPTEVYQTPEMKAKHESINSEFPKMISSIIWDMLESWIELTAWEKKTIRKTGLWLAMALKFDHPLTHSIRQLSWNTDRWWWQTYVNREVFTPWIAWNYTRWELQWLYAIANSVAPEMKNPYRVFWWWANDPLSSKMKLKNRYAELLSEWKEATDIERIL